MSAAQGGAWDGGPPGAEIDYAPRPSVGEQKVLPLPHSLSQWPPPMTFPPPCPFPAFSAVRPTVPCPPQFPTDADLSRVCQTSEFVPTQQQNSFHLQNQVREISDDKYASNKQRMYQEDRRYSRDDNYTRRRSRSREFRKTRYDSSHVQPHKTSRRTRSRSTSREKKSNRFKKSGSSSSDRSSVSPNDRRRRSTSSSSSKSGPRQTPSSSDRNPRKLQTGKADSYKNFTRSDEYNMNKRNLNSRHKSPSSSRSRERSSYQSRQTSGRHYPRSRSRSRERFNKRHDFKDFSNKSNTRSDNDSNKKFSEKRSSSPESNPRQKDSRQNARDKHLVDDSEQDASKKDHNSHMIGSRKNDSNSASSSKKVSVRPHESKTQIPAAAPFKNDGSFLEMFKKMQEGQTSQDITPNVVNEMPEPKKSALPFIGKRRGGRVLKTGMVKKAKTIEEHSVVDGPKDAWSLYLQEVKKYRETSCEEEGKTRPLVK